MDMKCMKCGEPWDWWHIRDEVLKDEALYQKMKKQGGFVKCDEDWVSRETDGQHASWEFSPGPYIQQCPCCVDEEVEEDEGSFYRQALAEILGDDIDGFIAECEDFGL